MELRFVQMREGRVFAVNLSDIMFIGQKTDVTEDFGTCVVQKALHNNGQFSIQLDDGSEYSVTVTEVVK